MKSFICLLFVSLFSPMASAKDFEIFDGRDPDQVTRAREHWTAYKAAGHTVTFATPRGMVKSPSVTGARWPVIFLCSK